MPDESFIHIRGARQNNLKNIELRIPRNKFVVITGVSGSGKSSLAFDTLFAEGQRRYLEALSTFARQAVGRLNAPLVDEITGLSPSIAIEQKGLPHNPRSTVGTLTEIYDYLRLIFAKLGTIFCPNCNLPIHAWTVPEIVVDLEASLPSKSRILILAPMGPMVPGRAEAQASSRDPGGFGPGSGAGPRGAGPDTRSISDAALPNLLKKLRRDGFARVRADGSVYELDPVPAIPRRPSHVVEVVIDRLVASAGGPTAPPARRLIDSLELALKVGKGIASVATPEGWEKSYCESARCASCGYTGPELTPGLFSFLHPLGMCPACQGLGADIGYQISEVGKLKTDIGYQVSDIGPPTSDLRPPSTVCPACNGTRLSEAARSVRLGGLSIDRVSAMTPAEAAEWLTDIGYQMADIGKNSLTSDVRPPTSDTRHPTSVLDRPRKEILARLNNLVELGVPYLTLDRPSNTLSGGEAQRVRLAHQLASRLSGVLYVLDEPSVGLHPRDHQRLLDVLMRLRDAGNSLVVVEHDRETILRADHLIDMGPGAGAEGGEVVFSGPPGEIVNCPASLTGLYLSGKKRLVPLRGSEKREAGSGNEDGSGKRVGAAGSENKTWGRIVPAPCSMLPASGPASLSPRAKALRGQALLPVSSIRLTGATGHNLKSVSVDFPYGCMTCVTGVSGSGKSTLVIDTLYCALAQKIHKVQTPPALGARKRAIPSGGRPRPGGGAADGIAAPPAPFLTLENVDRLRKVIMVDQSPIGRTPRSTPATYTGVFDLIRQLFSRVPEARARGWPAARFSFNQKGGRCEHCGGQGALQIEMYFLPDIYVVCPVCQGSRYKSETLEITYRGHSIASVLEMTVFEAAGFFSNFRQVRHKLDALIDVGMGYIRLGQPATTLSGGEAQRVKLAAELSPARARGQGAALYILDEPTTGLHFDDIAKLLLVLRKLVDQKNTVIIIEHHPDVIKSCDYVIDLGPEGGEGGGRIVAQGTPEEVARSKDSHTARFLRGNSGLRTED